MVYLDKIQEMSDKEYADYIRVQARGNSSSLVDMLHSDYHHMGHMDELHIGASDKDLLDRNVEKKKTCSTFFDKRVTQKALEKALIENADKIVRNIFRGDGKSFTIEVDMGEDIGYGYDVLYDKKTSSIAKFVIEPSRDYKSQWGFIVKTGYVDIEHASSDSKVIENVRIKCQEKMTQKEAEKDLSIRQMKFLGYKNTFPLSKDKVGLLLELTSQTRIKAILSMDSDEVKYQLSQKGVFKDVSLYQLLENPRIRDDIKNTLKGLADDFTDAKDMAKDELTFDREEASLNMENSLLDNEEPGHDNQPGFGDDFEEQNFLDDYDER